MNITEQINNVFHHEGVKPPGGGEYSRESAIWDSVLWSAMKHGKFMPEAAGAALWAMTKQNFGGEKTPNMAFGDDVSPADREAAVLFWTQGDSISSFAEARDASHAVYSEKHCKIAQRVAKSILVAMSNNGLNTNSDIAKIYPLDRNKITPYLPTFTTTESSASNLGFTMQEEMFGGDNPQFWWTSEWSDDGLELRIVVGRTAWVAENVAKMLKAPPPQLPQLADLTMVFDSDPNGQVTVRVKKYETAAALTAKPVALLIHRQASFANRTQIVFSDEPPPKVMDNLQMQAILEDWYPKVKNKEIMSGRPDADKYYVPSVLYGAAPVSVHKYTTELALLANSPDDKTWTIPLDEHGWMLYGIINTYNSYGVVNPDKYTIFRETVPSDHPAANVRFIGLSE